MSATPDSNLGIDNFFSGLLTSDITASSTDIPLDTIPTASQGFLVVDPDSTTNREVIFYTSKTSLKVTCPSAADGRGQDSTTATSHTSGTTVIMAPVKGIIAALQSLAGMTADAKGGWVSALSEGGSWAYSSYDSTNKTGVITVPSDATTQFTKGMRVRFTNNSATQYGIVTAITSTTLTVYFGTDYSLTNSAITSPFYSVHKAPYGFPLDPAKWTVEFTYTDAQSTTVASWGQAGTHQLTLPIGVWNFSARTQVTLTNTGASVGEAYVAYSTSTSSVSDAELVSSSGRNTYVSGATEDATSRVALDKPITVSAPTTYYEIIYAYNAGTAAVRPAGYYSIGGKGIIKTVCAYL